MPGSPVHESGQSHWVPLEVQLLFSQAGCLHLTRLVSSSL